MKPTVSKIKNMRGRITGYEARIGEVTAEGRNVGEASAACEANVLSALMRLDRGGLVLQWRGHFYIVAPTLDGWDYWIDTSTRGTFQPHSGNRDEVAANALHHLAQNVWTRDVDDREFLASLPAEVSRELSTWIKFQRAYTVLKADGKTDNEAHALASALSYEVSP